jgi:UPF0755 protein
MVKSNNTSFIKKVLISVAIVSVLLIFITIAFAFKRIYQPNVTLNGKETSFVYIPTGSNINDVCRILYEKNIIINRSSFEWIAEKKKYQNNIKPGKYKIKNKMSNNELINLLRSGNQEPVKLTFNNIRTVNQLAGVISRQIEADSASLAKLLNDNDYVQSYGFSSSNIISMFLPDTYEFVWNTSPESFVKRMNKEYVKFWNSTRLEKAKEIGLTQTEVITLASIVDEESNKPDEYAVIAGVYMNRLKKGIPLQADPTVKFALQDFTIKRVLKKHLQTESPYNTYLNKGVPPGPIAMPSIKAIESVLNYQKHNYLYFCAKSDFSGYHVFAKTLTQHNHNAQLYQAALNRNRIYN